MLVPFLFSHLPQTRVIYGVCLSSNVIGKIAHFIFLFTNIGHKKCLLKRLFNDVK